MLRRVGSHVRNQWIGTVALFLVVTGGTAYAVNEYTGANIQDGTLTTADIKNEDIRSQDVRDASRNGGGLTGAEIIDDSLTGADIDEGTLNASAIGGGERIGRFSLHSATNPTQVVPGLTIYSTFGSSPNTSGSDDMGITFLTDGPGTVNYMSVGSGIDGVDPVFADFHLANGARDGGGVLRFINFDDAYGTSFSIKNDHDTDSGSLTSAHSESQILIDSGGVTYDVSLHVYVREDGYSEAYGTAVRAG
jgi:hypothetical protein